MNPKKSNGRNDIPPNILRQHAPHIGKYPPALIRRLDPKRLAIDPSLLPAYLKHPMALAYQLYIFEQFREVITTPSIEEIVKTDDGWELRNDRRREIAARIELIIERHGLGVGMLVLHAQQMFTKHVLLELETPEGTIDLASETIAAYGDNDERIVFIPVRVFRTDANALAHYGIAKPTRLHDKKKIISHEGDKNPCFYCSAGEMNPNEVVVTLPKENLGLCRNYCFGFTFAPFGNPLRVCHFLAWDSATDPLNMSRFPFTFSDLVKLTVGINKSIAQFFSGTGIDDYPVIDGVSNGWAGNSIYHQHFQFFEREFTLPIEPVGHLDPNPLILHDGISVHEVRWPTPILQIATDSMESLCNTGNEISLLWRHVGGDLTELFKTFPDGYTPTSNDFIPRHTQNLYIPGAFRGELAYYIPRDKRNVNYERTQIETDGMYLDERQSIPAFPKNNIGIMEETGQLIVDDRKVFDQAIGWEPKIVGRQVRRIISATRPDDDHIATFKESVRKSLFSHRVRSPGQ
jgi:hypothetical protein